MRHLSELTKTIMDEGNNLTMIGLIHFGHTATTNKIYQASDVAPMSTKICLSLVLRLRYSILSKSRLIRGSHL